MYQKILVPIDGSATSNKGLDEAIKLARLTGARLRLLNVIDEFPLATGFEAGALYTPQTLDLLREGGTKLLADAQARAVAGGVEAETRLVEGTTHRLADIVGDEVKAWPADLIVIGTHGRRGLGRLLLGSDAETILRTAAAPVLLVRDAA